MGTVRQAVLVNGIAEGMSITDAGILAGYKSVQNASDAYQSIRNKMIDDLGKIGIGTMAIALKIKEKMDAKATRLFSSNGIITDAIDLEDHGTQLHATEMAADILGLRGSKDSGTSIGTVNILWAGQSPAWAKPDVSANAVVNVDNQSVTVVEGVPISTVEGTGPEGGPSTRTHCSSSGKAPVLTQRVIKKRKPRLPVYRGEK